MWQEDWIFNPQTTTCLSSVYGVLEVPFSESCCTSIILTVAQRSRQFKECEYHTQDPYAVRQSYYLQLLATVTFPFIRSCGVLYQSVSLQHNDGTSSVDLPGSHPYAILVIAWIFIHLAGLKIQYRERKRKKKNHFTTRTHNWMNMTNYLLGNMRLCA